MIDSNLNDNPRHDMPVPQWIMEWEKKWDRMHSGKESKSGKGGEAAITKEVQRMTISSKPKL